MLFFLREKDLILGKSAEDSCVIMADMWPNFVFQDISPDTQSANVV